jgi:hypothetical protein
VLLLVRSSDIASVLVLRRVEHAEDAGASAYGVGDGVVVEGVGAEHLEPGAGAGRQLLLVVVGVRGGVDGVSAAEEAVDERGAQRARRVHDADAPAGPRRLHRPWTHAWFVSSLSSDW